MLVQHTRARALSYQTHTFCSADHVVLMDFQRDGVSGGMAAARRETEERRRKKEEIKKKKKRWDCLATLEMELHTHRLKHKSPGERGVTSLIQPCL